MRSLAVNVNKSREAAHRRARQRAEVLAAVGVFVAAGAPGITVHPRADRRHITPEDVREIARELRSSAARRIQHRR